MVKDKHSQFLKVEWKSQVVGYTYVVVFLDEFDLLTII